MASAVCSRSPFSSLAAACIVCCCFLIRLPAACCSADGGGAAAAAAFHAQQRDAAAADIVGRALFCFNDPSIYSGCQQVSFRLGPQGTLDVPPGSVDAFCGGPCLAETELVLRCVDGIMSNFRFYNGASAADVRFALDRGCGYSSLRGDFNVLQRIGSDGNYGDGDFYGRSVNNVAAMVPLLLSAAAAILVWA